MILPEPRKDVIHQRGKAFLSTILLMAGCYALLLFASVSFEKPSRRIFREVDLASFAPPAVTPDLVTPTSETPDAEEAPAESRPVRQEINTPTLDQLDLSKLFPDELAVEIDPADTPGNVRNAQADAGAGEQIQVQSGGLQGLGSLDGLDNLGGAPVPAGRGRTARQAGNTGGGIELADGSSAVTPGQANATVGGNTSVVGENTRRAATAEAADFNVQRLSLDAFGNDYANLEVQALIDWMKANPGELPVGVRKLVRHRDNFLTSATSFEMDGKRYELYLMCKEKLYEVHIVLVDIDEATYLIDRSFQKLSTYLREGQVGRSSSDIITAINSRRSAASDERSNEFYSLFLSWWETAKQSL